MADCCVTPDPRGDFAGWMAAKGGQASFAQAMAQELGIRDYEALLACSEDAQVLIVSAYCFPEFYFIF